MSRSSTIRAVVATVVPQASSLDDRSWAEVLSLIDRAVAERPSRVKRQLALFIRVLELAPVLRKGIGFSRLGAEERTRWLLRFQNSPLKLLRRGLWGLRTLAFMGYYGRAAAASEIGYSASASGWDGRSTAPGGTGR